jgi:alpha-1,6-mannosyltransferase
MRIVQIANFYSTKSGGIRTSMIELGKQYALQGHECWHFVPGRKFQIKVAEFGEIIEFPSLKIPFSGGYRIILKTKLVLKKLSQISPDVIELHDRLTLLSVAKWAKQNNIRVVIFAHEVLNKVIRAFIPIPLALENSIKKWNIKTAKIADKIVCTTEFAAQEFRSINATNIEKIPLGVDHSMFNPQKKSDFVKNSYAPDGILLVLASRLSKEKDPELAFEVLENLVKNNVNAYLLVVGAGPLKKHLKKKYYDLPVTFKGFISDRNQLSILLASADVLLAPGPNETFCLAALEAMAAGTPVLAREESALREVVLFDGGGLANRDVNRWTRLINRLANEKNARDKTRKHALKYSWGKSADLLVELYKSEIDTSESKHYEYR